MEKCDRCGKKGEDRRTLHMACFYAMEELDVPFKHSIVFTPKDIEDIESGTEKPIRIGNESIAITAGSVRCKGELYPKGQYTLKVCKNCRATWMEAIEHWFKTTDYRYKPTGTGVYFRKNGANVELTELEIDDYKQVMGREPVRVVNKKEIGHGRKRSRK